MFYKKHLHSIEELQAERLALKKKARKRTLELSKPAAKDKNENMLSKGVGFLSGSMMSNSKFAPVVGVATKMVLPYLVTRGAQMGVKKIAMTALKEVTFGYVKWKAISIAVRIISNKIKKRKEA